MISEVSETNTMDCDTSDSCDWDWIAFLWSATDPSRRGQLLVGFSVMVLSLTAAVWIHVNNDGPSFLNALAACVIIYVSVLIIHNIVSLVLKGLSLTLWEITLSIPKSLGIERVISHSVRDNPFNTKECLGAVTLGLHPTRIPIFCNDSPVVYFWSCARPILQKNDSLS